MVLRMAALGNWYTGILISALYTTKLSLSHSNTIHMGQSLGWTDTFRAPRYQLLATKDTKKVGEAESI